MIKMSEPISPTGVDAVLNPIGVERFFADYWEQAPLHIARTNHSTFADLLSISAIEELLSTNALTFPTVQLSQSGQTIPVSDYADGSNVILNNRIIERYRSGSTIVVSQAQELVASLMTLCRSVQASLMMRCQTNVYLSPAGNQGFNPHYDTHDVFILQVSGRKTFNFYSAAAEFPTSADRFNRDVHEIGDKTEEIALSAGDTLYIPRGFIHDAIADSSEPSLHITLGVYPVLLHTLIKEVTNIAVESDSRMRRALAQSVWTGKESSSSAVQQIQKVFADHLNEEVVNAALQRLRDDMALDSSQDCRGLLTTTPHSKIDLTTALRIHHDRIIHIERVDDAVFLRIFGQVLEFNGVHGVAIDWLMQRNEVRFRDIPDLSDEQQFALMTQLISADLVASQ